jgi:hypothetical protein
MWVNSIGIRITENIVQIFKYCTVRLKDKVLDLNSKQKISVPVTKTARTHEHKTRQK